MEQNLPAVGAPVEPTVMQHTRGPWHVSGSGPTVYALHGQPQRNRFSATMQAGRRADAPLLELVANAELCATAPAMAAALDCIVRRLQMDVDDGSRPDKWTMEDLIRTAIAALPAGWVIGAA